MDLRRLQQLREKRMSRDGQIPLHKPIVVLTEEQRVERLLQKPQEERSLDERLRISALQHRQNRLFNCLQACLACQPSDEHSRKKKRDLAAIKAEEISVYEEAVTREPYPVSVLTPPLSQLTTPKIPE